jgi:hypothetical protein
MNQRENGVPTNPDNMTRREKIAVIKAFSTDEEASSWWIKWALGSVSKKAFYAARGHE